MALKLSPVPYFCLKLLTFTEQLKLSFFKGTEVEKIGNDQYAAVTLFKMDISGSARRHHHSFRGTWQKLKVYYEGWQGVRRRESTNRFPERIHLWSSLQNISRALGREESLKRISGILMGQGLGGVSEILRR